MNKLEASVEILKLVLASDDSLQKVSIDERLNKILDCFEQIYQKLRATSEETNDSNLEAIGFVEKVHTDGKPDDKPGKKIVGNQLIFKIDSALLREIEMVNSGDHQPVTINPRDDRPVMIDPGDDQPGKPGGSSGGGQSGGSGSKR